jgi:signal transduction histidine kinase
MIVLAAFQVVGTFAASQGQPERRDLDALAIVLLLAGPAALTLRYRYPRATLAATVGVAVLYLLLDFPYGPILVGVVVALFTAVALSHRTAAWLAAAGFYVGHFLGRFLLDRYLDRDPLTGADQGVVMTAWLAWLIVVLVVAEVARVRRERAAEAARTREEEARRRASEERLRIARELHDVLAHSISMINIQAGVGLELMESRPEQARIALSTIKQASKDALTEVRSVLGMLRQTDEELPRTPTAGLSRLDELVTRSAAAGLTVRTEVGGDPRPLAAGVDLAAYRIVQEALTNVSRHSGATTATVRIGYGDDAVTVQVEDPGGGAGHPAAPDRPGGTGGRDGGSGGGSRGGSGGGNGIPGMRERVAALGGELEAGPRPGGGFRVWARLPALPPGR